MVSDSSPPRKIRRRWLVLLTAATLFLSTGVTALVLIVRECGKEEFCVRLSELLSRRLNAEVVWWPMRSHSLLFVDCPLIQVRDPAGRWAFRAQNVSFELQPSSILAGGLGFRSVLVREAELWLGGDPDQQGVSPIDDQAGQAGPKPSGLPWWLDGRLQDLSRIPMESIEIASLTIRGHESAGAAQDAPFEVATAASGRLRDRRLEWRFTKGHFAVPGQDSWTVSEFAGAWEREGLRLDKGVLVSSGGAVVSCRSQTGQPPGNLALEVEARQITLRPSGMEVEEALGPISKASASVTGTLWVRFPEVQRFHFAGDVKLDGLSLGQSKIFRLLAGQTGEEKLRHPASRTLTGRMECSPGVVRLTRLSLMEKGLFRLEGWLSVVAADVLGVFDLALPAPVVGRIPGGKPKGFSYPASGWSWARLRVEGKTGAWQEDLSQRLMAQISRDIPVKAGPPLELLPTGGGGADPGPKRTVTSGPGGQRREEVMERLFYTLIGH